MVKNLLFVLFTLGLIISCKQHIIDPSEEYNLHKGDVSIKYLPCNEDDLYYTSSKIKSLNADLNLYPIENGFDSVQLRIWFGYYRSFSDSAFHLLIFKKFKKQDWTATLVDFSYPVEGGFPDIDTMPKIKSKSIEFRSGIFSFFDKSKSLILENGGIAGSCIKEPEDRVSFNYVIIELAGERHYYLANFPSPSDIKSECGNREKKLLIEFLTFLKKEYNFKFIDDYMR